MSPSNAIYENRLFQQAASVPDQIVHSLKATRNLEGLPEKERVENVVVLGMGASGIAGDVLSATASALLALPIVVVKNYEIPAFVGEGSLVFAVSVSGNTEETIDAATDAATQGAKVVVVSGGGQLADLAGNWGAPYVRLPKVGARSRFALGSLALPPIAILEEIGLFPGAGEWISLAVEQLAKRRDELMKPGNIAEQLASDLDGRITIIHGGGQIGWTAAQRWATQLNLNAKLPAYWAAQPEVTHNELAGWEGLTDITGRHVAHLALRHDDEHPQIVRRFDFVKETLRGKVASLSEVRADGDGQLAQVLDLMMVGDFTSLHLAARRGVDAEDQPTIDALRNTLEER